MEGFLFFFFLVGEWEEGISQNLQCCQVAPLKGYRKAILGAFIFFTSF